PTGDRGANLARAIACYEEALRYYTPEAAPLAYAMTQNNLGLAYADLPTGDRGANLARAIACYEESLRFRTPEAAPLDYARTQYNLGTAYYELGQLEQAADAYRRAVETVADQGSYQMALGSVLRKLGRDDEAAIHLARARELLPPDDHYDRACLEAIAGNTDAALAHLEKALAWDATSRDWAARDPDLESLRDHPRFKALIARNASC
ncbi:MAG TPA: tetratricopeptide repeat protein, partial [Anaerolineae bacterium]|nr:tetratricopeptide repeat protein [Anaerolineae bacterium]